MATAQASGMATAPVLVMGQASDQELEPDLAQAMETAKALVSQHVNLSLRIQLPKIK